MLLPLLLLLLVTSVVAATNGCRYSTDIVFCYTYVSRSFFFLCRYFFLSISTDFLLVCRFKVALI